MASNPTVVGVFILGALGLGAGALVLFGGTTWFTPVVHAVVHFQGSVANLGVGAPVTFRGVQVGTVTAISITLNTDTLVARIPVFLDLDPSLIVLDRKGSAPDEARFDELLKAGLHAQLNMQSLITGRLRIDLDIKPGVTGTVLGEAQDRPEIPSIPSTLQTIESAITDLPLKEMVENTRQTLIALQRIAEILPREIGPLADSIKQTSDAARVTLAAIDHLAVTSEHQLAGVGDHLGRVLETSERTLTQAGALVGSINAMTNAESSMRAGLEATVRDLAASASALRGFAHTLERDPSALIGGRP
ncbi:MlaD family protein [Pararhodospirillum photometricum]|uniref:Mammalian cell entry related n=1 Tax=Pararhodospirillum photometricum DSM 122 TaxID=1150469 RepID=H6SL22_PARPM|nr:MlaD family protein [Pararhodospirillum photometricum]CCG08687.1 Mammalian cell entry related [Pararhodospirillum photometricum DSM 122]